MEPGEYQSLGKVEEVIEAWPEMPPSACKAVGFEKLTPAVAATDSMMKSFDR